MVGVHTGICAISIWCTTTFFIEAVEFEHKIRSLEDDDREVLLSQMAFWRGAPEVKEILNGTVVEEVDRQQPVKAEPEFSQYEFEFTTMEDICNASYTIFRSAVGEYYWKCPPKFKVSSGKDRIAQENNEQKQIDTATKIMSKEVSESKAFDKEGLLDVDNDKTKPRKQDSNSEVSEMGEKLAKEDRKPKEKRIGKTKDAKDKDLFDEDHFAEDDKNHKQTKVNWSKLEEQFAEDDKEDPFDVFNDKPKPQNQNSKSEVSKEGDKLAKKYKKPKGKKIGKTKVAKDKDLFDEVLFAEDDKNPKQKKVNWSNLEEQFAEDDKEDPFDVFNDKPKPQKQDSKSEVSKKGDKLAKEDRKPKEKKIGKTKVAKNKDLFDEDLFAEDGKNPKQKKVNWSKLEEKFAEDDKEDPFDVFNDKPKTQKQDSKSEVSKEGDKLAKKYRKPKEKKIGKTKVAKVEDLFDEVLFAEDDKNPKQKKVNWSKLEEQFAEDDKEDPFDVFNDKPKPQKQDSKSEVSKEGDKLAKEDRKPKEKKIGKTKVAKNKDLFDEDLFAEDDKNPKQKKVNWSKLEEQFAEDDKEDPFDVFNDKPKTQKQDSKSEVSKEGDKLGKKYRKPKGKKIGKTKVAKDKDLFDEVLFAEDDKNPKQKKVNWSKLEEQFAEDDKEDPFDVFNDKPKPQKQDSKSEVFKEGDKLDKKYRKPKGKKIGKTKVAKDKDLFDEDLFAEDDKNPKQKKVNWSKLEEQFAEDDKEDPFDVFNDKPKTQKQDSKSEVSKEGGKLAKKYKKPIEKKIGKTKVAKDKDLFDEVLFAEDDKNPKQKKVNWSKLEEQFAEDDKEDPFDVFNDKPKTQKQDSKSEVSKEGDKLGKKYRKPKGKKIGKTKVAKDKDLFDEVLFAEDDKNPKQKKVNWSKLEEQFAEDDKEDPFDVFNDKPKPQKQDSKSEVFKEGDKLGKKYRKPKGKKIGKTKVAKDKDLFDEDLFAEDDKNPKQKKVNWSKLEEQFAEDDKEDPFDVFNDKPKTQKQDSKSEVSKEGGKLAKKYKKPIEKKIGKTKVAKDKDLFDEVLFAEDDKNPKQKKVNWSKLEEQFAEDDKEDPFDVFNDKPKPQKQDSKSEVFKEGDKLDKKYRKPKGKKIGKTKVAKDKDLFDEDLFAEDDKNPKQKKVNWSKLEEQFAEDDKEDPFDVFNDKPKTQKQDSKSEVSKEGGKLAKKYKKPIEKKIGKTKVAKDKDLFDEVLFAEDDKNPKQKKVNWSKLEEQFAEDDKEDPFDVFNDKPKTQKQDSKSEVSKEGDKLGKKYRKPKGKKIGKTKVAKDKDLFDEVLFAEDDKNPKQKKVNWSKLEEQFAEDDKEDPFDVFNDKPKPQKQDSKSEVFKEGDKLGKKYRKPKGKKIGKTKVAKDKDLFDEDLFAEDDKNPKQKKVNWSKLEEQFAEDDKEDPFDVFNDKPKTQKQDSKSEVSKEGGKLAKKYKKPIEKKIGKTKVAKDKDLFDEVLFAEDDKNPKQKKVNWSKLEEQFAEDDKEDPFDVFNDKPKTQKQDSKSEVSKEGGKLAKKYKKPIEKKIGKTKVAKDKDLFDEVLFAEDDKNPKQKKVNWSKLEEQFAEDDKEDPFDVFNDKPKTQKQDSKSVFFENGYQFAEGNSKPKEWKVNWSELEELFAEDDKEVGTVLNV